MHNETQCASGCCTAEHPDVHTKDKEHDQGQGHGHVDGCGCGHDHAHSGTENFTPFILRLCAAFAMILAAGFITMPVYASVPLYVAAYFLAGAEVLWTACKNIAKGKMFDENFLMTIASIGAFAIGDMSEAVAVMIFYGAGELLQDVAVARSRENIANLMDIRPDAANLKTEDGLVTVSPEAVPVGTTIVVRPGEKIPLDGLVLRGESFVDTMALTGESVPRSALEGDEVLSGSINKSGLLEIQVTKPYGESTVSKVLELVQNASSKKAESEKFITKFARYYTPAVVFGALGVAILPPLLGFGPWGSWLYKALSFLIISCPCALVVSIPISFFGGIGGAAKNGVLVKGGNFLEALNDVETVVFDKTGTLTKGVFKVTEIAPVEGVSQQELLGLAAVAEAHSTHPIAQSILAAYVQTPEVATEITEQAGLGITAKTARGTICVGNASLMEQVAGIQNLPAFAKTTVYVALNGQYMGYMLISDEIKETTAAGLAALRQWGVKRLVMLTGDSKALAGEVANTLSLDDYQGGLLPQDKVFEFEKLLAEGKGKVVFVGDGINDAPVLTRAHIGIAMGGIGSDAAIEAADVVIMNDDIGKIATALRVARKTRSIVVQNIVFALGVKLAIMVLAFLGITSIWFAIFADVGVALLALLNAVRAMVVKS